MEFVGRCRGLRSTRGSMAGSREARSGSPGPVAESERSSRNPVEEGPHNRSPNDDRRQNSLGFKSSNDVQLTAPWTRAVRSSGARISSGRSEEGRSGLGPLGGYRRDGECGVQPIMNAKEPPAAGSSHQSSGAGVRGGKVWHPKLLKLN